MVRPGQVLFVIVSCFSFQSDSCNFCTKTICIFRLQAFALTMATNVSWQKEVALLWFWKSVHLRNCKCYNIYKKIKNCYCKWLAPIVVFFLAFSPLQCLLFKNLEYLMLLFAIKVGSRVNSNDTEKSLSSRQREFGRIPQFISCKSGSGGGCSSSKFNASSTLYWLLIIICICPVAASVHCADV